MSEVRIDLPEDVRQTVRLLLSKWRTGYSPTDPFTETFATSAIDAFAEYRDEKRDSVDEQAIQGGDLVAESLNPNPFHGVLEILQNANDAGATYVKVALEKRNDHWTLLFVHDGKRVAIRDAIAMAYAFVSNKSELEDATGKFGIGLKTLKQLGPDLEVHSHPYHFVVSDATLRNVEPWGSITGLYGGHEDETLMAVRCSSGFNAEEFKEWFKGLGAESLLFLKCVRSCSLATLPRMQVVVEHRLAETESETLQFAWTRGTVDCTRTRLLDPASGDHFDRFVADVPVTETARKARRGKRVGETTPIGVAFCSSPKVGRLYASLPTRQILATPFSIDARFDPDTSRERLLESREWNPWLLHSVGHLLTQVAQYYFITEPNRAWEALLLEPEVSPSHTADEWLCARLAEVLHTQRSYLEGRLKLTVRGRSVRMRDLAYESSGVDGIPTLADIEKLREGSAAVPRNWRDREGRWRHVLDEVGVSGRVEESDLLDMLEWKDERLGERSARWFIRVAASAIRVELGSRLFLSQSVVLQDGSRTVPVKDGLGTVLVLESGRDELAAALGLTGELHERYSDGSSESRETLEYLRIHGAVSDLASSDVILRALAGRQDSPCHLSDEQLERLREHLGAVGEERAQELGHGIGEAITVDGYHFEGGKRAPAEVSPASAYLPLALEGKDGWATAAGDVPGLYWIAPRYAKDLRRAREADVLGARRLFTTLGAETAPRLIRPPHADHHYQGRPPGYWISDPPESQAAALREIQRVRQRTATHLLNDWASPDLAAVADGIAGIRSAKARRARGAALFAAISKAWNNRLERRSMAQAVFKNYEWSTAGDVQATWLARLASTGWMTSKSGKPLEPWRAFVGGDSMVALRGPDDDHMLSGIRPSAGELALMDALGVQTRPRASSLVGRLEEVKRTAERQGERVLFSEVSALYLGLAEHCRSRGLHDSLVDDVPISDFRRRFSMGRLVLPLGGEAWMPPGSVFLDPDIFGRDAAFVPSGSPYLPLWQVLGIAEPAVSDCVEWLLRVASEKRNASQPELAGQLSAVYRLLARMADTTSPAARKRLRRLPLWSGAGWTKDRPLYVFEAEEVRDRLSDQGAPIWSCPGAPEPFRPLCEYLGVIFEEEDQLSSAVVTNAELDAGADQRDIYESALEALRAHLSHDFPTVVESLPVRAWEQAHLADIAIRSGLEAVLEVDGRRYESPTSALLLSGDPPTLLVESVDALGRADSGGRLVAGVLGVEQESRAACRFVWESCWASALRSEGLRSAVSLPVSAAPEPSNLPIFGTAIPLDERSPKKDKGQVTVSIPPRHLKVPEQILLGPGSHDDGNSEKHRAKKGTRKPLANDSVTPRSAGRGKAPRGYTDREREAAGLTLLALVLAERSVSLEDRTHQDRFGADALGSDGRFYELKVHAGSAPDEIRMEPYEVQRAAEQASNYVLVVIEGVEDGETTQITMVANPLASLTRELKGQVILSGYRRAPDEVLVQLQEPAS